ncbi:MAG: hypothetical protein ACLP19_11580, partial [Xanthobacteraceae bacterium]
MSSLLERRRFRELNGSEPKSSHAAEVIRRSRQWANALAGHAMPLGATFALVWLATVGLVVINYFVPLNLVTLVYMLPVVVAATQR